MYDIHIQKVVNGVIISIGCQRYVSTDIPLAMKEIQLYLEDPQGQTERWQKRYPQLLNNAPIAPAPAHDHRELCERPMGMGEALTRTVEAERGAGRPVQI